MIECPNSDCCRSANLKIHEAGPIFMEECPEAIIGAYLDINCENCGRWWQQGFYEKET